LPVAHADFIFAGYAEATGFVGSIVLIGLYVTLILRIISIARMSNDPFGRLLAVGIGAKILFQVTVHIGMNIGILPVTGIPLPFMSYGGTSLIIDLASIGILQSIYIRHKKTLFVRE
jgi:rod shape determining protein RodA